MGLVEFLRQWQGSRLAGGIALSVALHLALVAAVLWGPPVSPTLTVKRGEPLIVELSAAPESPPPGRPGSPPTPPPARRTPPPRKASPAPPAVAARPAPPRPEPRPADPAREQRVARAEPPAARPPVPKAPDTEQAVPAPKAPEADTPAKAPEPPAEAAAPPQPAPPAPPAAAPESAPPAAPAEPPAPQVAALPPAPAARPLPDIRSLGRGSGSGAGRAGIEGEPIPLDSEDPRYSDYLDQVRRRIKDKWGYPCVKNGTTRECEYKTVQLIIEFGIAKNGKVPFITVVRSSGYAIYDDYAVNAVKLADFPPIPDAFSKTGVPILATFSYVVQSSLTNILR